MLNKLDWDDSGEQYIVYIKNNSNLFDEGFKTVLTKTSPEIKVKLGKLKETGKLSVYAFMFLRKDWTIADAKDWILFHDKKSYSLKNEFKEFVSFKFNENVINSEQEIQDLFIEGIASTSGRDRGQDSVLSSVWTEKVINDFLQKNPVLMYFHKCDQPAIGEVLFIDVIPNVGVAIKAVVRKERPDVIKDIKANLIKGLSIGFKILEWLFDPAVDEFIIKALELVEISVCAIPMNADTLFEISKSFKGEVSPLINVGSARGIIKEEQVMDNVEVNLKLRQENEEMAKKLAEIEQIKRVKEAEEKIATAVNKASMDKEEVLTKQFEEEKKTLKTEIQVTEMVELAVKKALETQQEVFDKKIKTHLSAPVDGSKRVSFQTSNNEHNKKMFETLAKLAKEGEGVCAEVKMPKGVLLLRTKSDTLDSGTTGSGTDGDVAETPEVDSTYLITDSAARRILPLSMFVARFTQKDKTYKWKAKTAQQKAQYTGETYVFNSKIGTYVEHEQDLNVSKVDGAITKFLDATARDPIFQMELMGMQNALERLDEFGLIWGDKDASNSSAGTASFGYDGVNTRIDESTDVFYQFNGTKLSSTHLFFADGEYLTNSKDVDKELFYNFIMMSPKMWVKLNQIYHNIKNVLGTLEAGGMRVPVWNDIPIRLSTTVKSYADPPVGNPSMLNSGSIADGVYQLKVSGISLDGETKSLTLAAQTVATPNSEIKIAFPKSNEFYMYRVYISDKDGAASTCRLVGTYINHDIYETGITTTDVNFATDAAVTKLASDIQPLGEHDEPIFFISNDPIYGLQFRVHEKMDFERLGAIGDGRKRFQITQYNMAVLKVLKSVFRITVSKEL